MARLKMSSFFSARSTLLASVALLFFVPGAQAFDAAEPVGRGYAITVPEPAATYPLPLADNYRNQTGKNEKGEEVRAYDDRNNPIIEILSGFNRIWTLGDEKWADGGANGDGPADFSHVKIVDPAVWQENMRYVLSVTGENRTRAAAFEAYMNPPLAGLQRHRRPGPACRMVSRRGGCDDDDQSHACGFRSERGHHPQGGRQGHRGGCGG
nr:hypothetical protein [Agrobacterium tumefaciens]